MAVLDWQGLARKGSVRYGTERNGSWGMASTEMECFSLEWNGSMGLGRIVKLRIVWDRIGQAVLGWCVMAGPGS